jgi:Asp-tRNA(Asn)/Glu-tRNA(Gln) amidotransferase A subunit family amidase
MGGLNYLSATAAARKLARREITAESLLSGCLECIAAREGVVHAWTCIETHAPLQRAWSLDAQGSAVLLHGLLIGVTDLFDTFDLPTTYDSPIYANHRPAADAACVALVRAAGGIVGDKTVTTEFATFHPGPACKPRNDDLGRIL